MGCFLPLQQPSGDTSLPRSGKFRMSPDSRLILAHFCGDMLAPRCIALAACLTGACSRVDTYLLIVSILRVPLDGSRPHKLPETSICILKTVC